MYKKNGGFFSQSPSEQFTASLNTILLSARLPEFKDPAVRAVAADNLKKRGIDGLVVIGGDGSFHGAHYVYEEHGIKTIGIPGTIDNDVAGTDYTIGYDTALNIILEK